MAAATLLCEIIAQGGNATAAVFRHRLGFTALVHAGLIKEDGITQSVVCNECSIAHDAQIVFESGHYGYWCPELGFVRVDRDPLVAVKPDLTALVAQLAELFACKRRRSTPLGSKTWRVGSVETAGGDLTIYLHPCLQHARDVRAIEAALLSEMKSAFRLVLTASGSLVSPNSKTVCLDDLIEIDPETGAIELLSDPGTLVGAPQEHPGGRPNQFKDKVDRIIAARAHGGEALNGRNEEAKAILGVYCDKYSGDEPPSLPTVKRYLSEFRSGS